MKNRLYIVFLIALAILSTGCRPKGILHSWEMREVIIDLHKTDAMLQLNGRRAHDNEIKAIYYAQVMEKHGITQAQFDSSLVWYTAHPQFFNKIYPKVLKELEDEEAAFLAAHEEELSTDKPGSTPVIEQVFTPWELDSVLWVTRNGPSHSWNEWKRPLPLVHNLEN